jgi:hypothetical protein
VIFPISCNFNRLSHQVEGFMLHCPLPTSRPVTNWPLERGSSRPSKKITVSSRHFARSRHQIQTWSRWELRKTALDSSFLYNFKNPSPSGLKRLLRSCTMLRLACKGKRGQGDTALTLWNVAQLRCSATPGAITQRRKDTTKARPVKAPNVPGNHTSFLRKHPIIKNR